MRKLLLAAGFWALICAAPVRAQDADIRKVIQSQIDAFLVDDFGAAFTFASPMIRRLFVTPESFGQMVRQGYPMVWRPSDLRFLELDSVDGRLVQRVWLLDRDGNSFVAEYEMVETPQGWLINGVRIEPLPEVGA